MINQKYLDQALRIRKDFLTTDSELLYLKDELKKIHDSINETLSKLKNVRDNSDKYKTNEEFQSEIIKYLKEFELQSDKANKVYKPLNIKMEKLKEEEQELYKTLVQNYPNINEESLIQEVQDYLRSMTT